MPDNSTDYANEILECGYTIIPDVLAGNQLLTAQRRALHLFYHRSWAKPQWDYPRSMSANVIGQLTVDEKRLFGFYSAPPLYDPATHEVFQPFGKYPTATSQK